MDDVLTGDTAIVHSKLMVEDIEKAGHAAREQNKETVLASDLAHVKLSAKARKVCSPSYPSPLYVHDGSELAHLLHEDVARLRSDRVNLSQGQPQ
jgi:hypothetical protein